MVDTRGLTQVMWILLTSAACIRYGTVDCMNMNGEKCKHKSKTVQTRLMYMENKLNGGFKLPHYKDKPSV